MAKEYNFELNRYIRKKSISYFQSCFILAKLYMNIFTNYKSHFRDFSFSYSMLLLDDCRGQGRGHYSLSTLYQSQFLFTLKNKS